MRVAKSELTMAGHDPAQDKANGRADAKAWLVVWQLEGGSRYGGSAGNGSAAWVHSSER